MHQCLIPGSSGLVVAFTSIELLAVALVDSRSWKNFSFIMCVCVCVCVSSLQANWNLSMAARQSKDPKQEALFLDKARELYHKVSAA